jgi:hypothetical protein
VVWDSGEATRERLQRLLASEEALEVRHILEKLVRRKAARGRVGDR